MGRSFLRCNGTTPPGDWTDVLSTLACTTEPPLLQLRVKANIAQTQLLGAGSCAPHWSQCDRSRAGAGVFPRPPACVPTSPAAVQANARRNTELEVEWKAPTWPGPG